MNWTAYPQSKPPATRGVYLVTLRDPNGGKPFVVIAEWGLDHWVGIGEHKVDAFADTPMPYKRMDTFKIRLEDMIRAAGSVGPVEEDYDRYCAQTDIGHLDAVVQHATWLKLVLETVE